MSGETRYLVVGHLATVTTGASFAVTQASLGGNRTRAHIMQGKLLPLDVPAHEIAHLLDVRIIEPVPSDSASVPV